MDALQQVWHWVNLLLLPCGLAAIHASICKLLWRREMRSRAVGGAWPDGVPWLRWRSIWLGFAWTGHDGAMLTYGAIVVALAVTTWLLAFAPWRRHAD